MRHRCTVTIESGLDEIPLRRVGRCTIPSKLVSYLALPRLLIARTADQNPAMLLRPGKVARPHYTLLVKQTNYNGSLCRLRSSTRVSSETDLEDPVLGGDNGAVVLWITHLLVVKGDGFPERIALG